MRVKINEKDSKPGQITLSNNCKIDSKMWDPHQHNRITSLELVLSVNLVKWIYVIYLNLNDIRVST